VDLEAKIAGMRAGGDLRGAAGAAVEGYGPEVLGFLVTTMRDEEDAREVFAQSCEDLWRGMERFEGRSSIRTWFYVVARHAAARFRRSPHRRAARAPLSEAEELAERVRTRTLPHLLTAVKDRFAALRDALDPEDQALLVLRVDRAMSFAEIAAVMSTDQEEDDDARARMTARMRKRFQLLKEEIRERARQAGLLDGGELD
jgi:RNA polymerase sigma-70 factor (ECF subfamily)